MDLTDLIIKKATLQRQITDLIANFEKETKIKLEEVRIIRTLKEGKTIKEEPIMIKGIELIFKL